MIFLDQKIFRKFSKWLLTPDIKSAIIYLEEFLIRKQSKYKETTEQKQNEQTKKKQTKRTLLRHVH